VTRRRPTSHAAVGMGLPTTLLSLALVGAACHSGTAPTDNRFQIGGSVYDTAFRLLVGARVEVVDGPLAGTSTITDSHGLFSFSDSRAASILGQPSNFTIRIIKQGYVSAQAQCCGYLYYLAPDRPPSISIESGEYSLTMVADEACTDIPEDLRTQSFPATVTQAANNVVGHYRIAVNYPGFHSAWDGNGFVIGIAGDYAAAPEETTLLWRVEPFRYFELGVFSDRNIISPNNTGLSMEFGLRYCELKSAQNSCFQSPADQVIARGFCSSPNNRLILTRR